MNKRCQIGISLPEDLYLKFELEARRSGDKIATVARKRLIESLNNEAEKSRVFALEQRLESMEIALQNQLKIVTKIDRALTAIGE